MINAEKQWKERGNSLTYTRSPKARDEDPFGNRGKLNVALPVCLGQGLIEEFAVSTWYQDSVPDCYFPVWAQPGGRTVVGTWSSMIPQ